MLSKLGDETSTSNDLRSTSNDPRSTSGDDSRSGDTTVEVPLDVPADGEVAVEVPVEVSDVASKLPGRISVWRLLVVLFANRKLLMGDCCMGVNAYLMQCSIS